MNKDIKELVREKLSAKRIVLFGAGIVAEEFYQVYKEKLNICSCVSNLEKEWGKVVLGNTLEVKPFRSEEIGPEDYIIVCGPVAFRTIELQLKAEGFEMYEDFIEAQIAEAIWANKKIALFYGQCVLRDIYRCCVQVKAFTDEYFPVFTQAVTGQAVVTNRVLYYVKDLCDIYVYTPKLLDYDSIYFLSPEELPINCKIVSVSNLLVSLYWPQIDAQLKAYNDLYLHAYNAKRDMDFYHSLYRRADKNINKMVLEGKTSREIIEALSDTFFYDEKQIKRNCKIALKSIEIAENKVDVKMGDFIKENYARIKLYQNFLHPNKRIVWEYTRRLMHEMAISDGEIEQLENKSREHIHQGGDVPIYPSVAKTLELEFIDENTKYEILIGNGIVYMTFEEYIEHYVEYTRKALEVINMW